MTRMRTPTVPSRLTICCPADVSDRIGEASVVAIAGTAATTAIDQQTTSGRRRSPAVGQAATTAISEIGSSTAGCVAMANPASMVAPTSRSSRPQADRRQEERRRPEERELAEQH